MWPRVTAATAVTSGWLATRKLGEAAQRLVGAVDAAGAQGGGDLVEVAAHRGGQRRGGCVDARPRSPVGNAGCVTAGLRTATRAGCCGCGVLVEDLRVDGFGGSAVLGGEPVVGQVQVDAGRLDRARARPGPGPPPAPCPPPAAGSGRCGAAGGRSPAPARPGCGRRRGSRRDRSRGQRPPAARAFQDDEHPVGGGVVGSFVLEVVRRRRRRTVARRAPAVDARPCPRR